MKPRLHAVAFPNRRGLKLFGIVHLPAPQTDRETCVVLLSPGVKNRVAPHRLYNKMAEQLAEAGFCVFRFDFYGLGDSEGSAGERVLADLYGSIQVGRYVEDTWDALDWMRAEYGTQRFIIGGLCGGAITGVLAAGPRPDVAGILGLGIPVMLDGTNVDKTRFMTTGQLRTLKTKYLRKLADPRAWLRLLTFKSDFRLIARALSTARKPAAPPPPAPAGEPQDNANTLFPPAFFSLLGRKTPVLLLFSGADRLWWEFEEKFLARHREQLRAYDELLEIDVIEGANHVFTFDEWQVDMMRRCRAWLDRCFPAAQRRAAEPETVA